jgi:acetoin utilization transport system permease protein
MRLRDKFRFVRQNARKNGLRMFMTILATAMGCAFLILLASVGYGIQKTAKDKVLERGAVTEINIFGKKQTEGQGDPRMRDSDLAKLEKLEHVKVITKRNTIQNGLQVLIDGEKYGTQGIVIDPAAEKKAGMELAKGRFPERAGEVLVGSDFTKQMGPESKDTGYKGELVGKTIKLKITQQFADGVKEGEFSATIVGVLKAPAREWILDPNLYMGTDLLTQIEAFTKTPFGMMNDPMRKIDSENMKGTYSEVKVYVDTAENAKEVSRQIKDMGYYAHSPLDELEEIDKVFLFVKIGLVLVGAFAVLIASIGIFNTMTMAVTERSQEIGIMKAIGANPKTIRPVFLLESSFIGLFGAFIGVTAAYVIGFLANQLVPVIMRHFMGTGEMKGFVVSYIPLSLVLVSVSISVGVAILSGVRPAKRATEVDVLKALRRDI